MRVTSEKQTLILAGEPLPPRVDSGRSDASSQLKRVTMLWVQGEYVPGARTVTVESIPANDGMVAGNPNAENALPLAATAEASAADGAAEHLPAAPPDYRGLSAGAAEYARTQNFSGGRARRQIIDTYA